MNRNPDSYTPLAISMLVLVALMFLVGCAALNPKPVTPVVAPVEAKMVGSRIDARELIEAASDAGCDPSLIMYSEGKRESKIGVYCTKGLPVPKGF